MSKTNDFNPIYPLNDFTKRIEHKLRQMWEWKDREEYARKIIQSLKENDGFFCSDLSAQTLFTQMKFESIRIQKEQPDGSPIVKAISSIENIDGFKRCGFLIKFLKSELRLSDLQSLASQIFQFAEANFIEWLLEEWEIFFDSEGRMVVPPCIQIFCSTPENILIKQAYYELDLIIISSSLVASCSEVDL